MARLRSTKLRARRIELDYFARPHPLRRWRVWLSLGGVAGAAAWLAVLAARGDLQPFDAGPVAAGHAMLAARCEACHGAPAAPPDGMPARPAEIAARRGRDPAHTTAGRGAATAPLWRAASDAACLHCHVVADHQPHEATTPSCASCHVEHRGRGALAAVATVHCTPCHADLTGLGTRAEPQIVAADGRAIRGLADGHPEFAVWTRHDTEVRRVRLDATPPPRDGAQLKLNHTLHLKPGLRGPAGTPAVQLVCGDCHQGPMTVATWRFAQPASRDAPVAATPPELAPAEEPSYMAPVRFAPHCAGCHPNTFDARFPEMPAPHDQPAVIRAFLRGLYATYIVEHPEELRAPARVRPLGPGPAAAPPAVSAAAWVAAQVADAEALLFRKEGQKCQECHVLRAGAADGLPAVTPTRVPVRWLPQGVFDHGAHRVLRCTECHTAPESERTADILLPRITACRTCHHADGAPDRCATCHTYHAAPGRVDLNGRRTIEEVATTVPAGG